MAVAMPNDSVRRLASALGVSSSREATLRLAVDDVVTLATTDYATGDQLDRLTAELETSEWVLVPKTDWDIACGRVGFIASSLVEAVAKPRHPLLPPAYAPTALSNRVRPEVK